MQGNLLIVDNAFKLFRVRLGNINILQLVNDLVFSQRSLVALSFEQYRLHKLLVVFTV
jgi:hypothetical protein